jgi:hypothetical protein
MNPELRTPPDTSPSRGTSTARSRLLALIVSLAVLAVASIGLAGSASAKPRQALDPTAVSMTGTAADGSVVTGTFDVQRFVAQNGTLQAVGTFAETVAGTPTGDTQQIALPVNLQQSTGTCEILDLVLGPLHLDLLGLVVDLNQVHLTITAESGPGNLLGNLLCAIAGLLDGPTGVNAILTQIAALLNQLLGILG